MQYSLSDKEMCSALGLGSELWFCGRFCLLASAPEPRWVLGPRHLMCAIGADPVWVRTAQKIGCGALM